MGHATTTEVSMANVIHMEDVRRAAEKLCRMLQHIDIDRRLCTSDIIALSFWLIDHENIIKFQPVKRASNLLTECLEQQIIKRPAYSEIVQICTRCSATPILNRNTDTWPGSEEYRMHL